MPSACVTFSLLLPRLPGNRRCLATAAVAFVHVVECLNAAAWIFDCRSSTLVRSLAASFFLSLSISDVPFFCCPTTCGGVMRTSYTRRRTHFFLSRCILRHFPRPNFVQRGAATAEIQLCRTALHNLQSTPRKWRSAELHFRGEVVMKRICAKKCKIAFDLTYSCSVSRSQPDAYRAYLWLYLRLLLYLITNEAPSPLIQQPMVGIYTLFFFKICF